MFRLTDGSRVADTTVAWQRDAHQEGRFTYLAPVGDAVAVVQNIGGTQQFTVYDGTTLRELWQATSPGGSGLIDCGRLVCTVDQADLGRSNTLVARDPLTGRIRWRSPGWDWVQPMGRGMLLADGRTPANRQALIDESTGKVLADLGVGTPVLDPATGDLLMLTTSTTPPYGQRVSQVVDGKAYLLGRIGEVGDFGCQLTAHRLACRLGSGTMTVRAVG